MKLSEAFRRMTPRRHRRKLRRELLDAAAAAISDDARRAIREFGAALLDGLPTTIFRCAVCGTKVGTYDPDGTNFRAPECPQHGDLDLSLRTWRDKAAQRHDAEKKLTLKLRPVS
ncbi:hypothetical protein [Jiangella rhizosphaerae]|uniref:hypothetical protein n=1 Tax=Jiangella rhizosphaerae TaxID=2293569 RepID=UPI0011C43CCF|nr:hypothetical protein [Jiangella rhizosphaerae]